MLTGCSSNSLTNAEAETIIKANYPELCYTEHLIDSYDVILGRPTRHAKWIAPIEKFLKDGGYISMLREDNPNIGVVKYTMIPTQKANDLARGGKKFPIAQTDFVELIGISQKENEAVVRYKVIRSKTPFYPLHTMYYKGSKKTASDCPEEEFEVDVTLIRFDDGWKIK